MTTPHLTVKALSVKYNTQILEKAFLQLKKGEFISIIGKSGCGKTTLLNSIAGLIPSKGEIKRPNKISMVFQNNNLFPWMNLKENIAFGLKEPNEQQVNKIINLIGLTGRENSHPKELSGGQQQRVAIGRALVAESELLLLDEPFANLDSYTRIKTQDWLNEIININKTSTILVTHDIDEALLLSDRILILKDKTLMHEYTIPFTKPRENNLRYTQKFQELKKEIIEKL